MASRRETSKAHQRKDSGWSGGRVWVAVPDLVGLSTAGTEATRSRHAVAGRNPFKPAAIRFFTVPGGSGQSDQPSLSRSLFEGFWGYRIG